MNHQAKKRTGRGGVSCIARRKRSFNTLVIFFLLFAAVLLTVGTTSAQAMEMDFNIPAQTLSSALKTFAEETGLQMLYSSDAVKGIRSSRVKDRYQPKDALNILLGGTGLSFKFTDSNTVVVQKNKETVQSGTETEAERDKVYMKIGEITVTGKTDFLTTADAPASVDVIGSDQIEMENVHSSMELMKKIPGAYFGNWNQGILSSSFSLRGYDIT
jgi:hypothetical protein